MRCFNNVFALAINSSNVVSVVTSYLPSNWLVVLRPVAPHLRHSDKQFLSPKNCFCICEVFVHCVIAVCAAMVGCYTCTCMFPQVCTWPWSVLIAWCVGLIGAYSALRKMSFDHTFLDVLSITIDIYIHV